MPETTALGAAMAAGHSAGLWSLKPEDLAAITTDVFEARVSHEGTSLHLSSLSTVQWSIIIDGAFH